VLLSQYNRPVEALGVFRMAIELGGTHDLVSHTLGAYNNLCVFGVTRDLAAARDAAREGLAHAQRVGDQYAEFYLRGQVLICAEYAGDWDEVERVTSELPDPESVPVDIRAFLWASIAFVRCWRGDVEAARASAQLSAKSDDPQVA